MAKMWYFSGGELMDESPTWQSINKGAQHQQPEEIQVKIYPPNRYSMCLFSAKWNHMTATNKTSRQAMVWQAKSIPGG